jgi:hypothetical protein
MTFGQTRGRTSRQEKPSGDGDRKRWNRGDRNDSPRLTAVVKIVDHVMHERPHLSSVGLPAPSEIRTAGRCPCDSGMCKCMWYSVVHAVYQTDTDILIRSFEL